MVRPLMCYFLPWTHHTTKPLSVFSLSDPQINFEFLRVRDRYSLILMLTMQALQSNASALAKQVSTQFVLIAAVKLHPVSVSWQHVPLGLM